jgi:DNA-binding XRE family transcriptional regulator
MHFLLQRVALAVRDMLHANLAGFAIHAHDQFLSRSASADYLLCFLVLVHETSAAADHGFIGFDWAAPAEFRETPALHCKPDAVKHEPSGFLADLQVARDFPRTDPVLAVVNQPDGRQPFSRRQRRILEDGPDLNAELPAGMMAQKGKEVAMARNVDDIINKVSPAQRKKIEARAAELIAEEMTLQQLRHARKLTQQRIAKSLHIGQEGVSKIEKRSDLLISTLRSYVEAMGGSLSIIAECADRRPVMLSGIATMDTKPASHKRDDA